MKALSLWQPWASLVACGAKTIETRSWSTHHRGPLAIHATARRPDEAWEGGGWAIARQWMGMTSDWLMYRTSYSVDGIKLPLGAVVATCDLIDVVPIVDGFQLDLPKPFKCVANYAGAHAHELYLNEWDEHGQGGGGECTTQLPFGDFTPGRHAWLLADIVKLSEPIPARGRRGLFSLPETATP